MRSGRNSVVIDNSDTLQSRRLGYALWPELHRQTQPGAGQSRRLGYALWPEQRQAAANGLR